MRRRRTPFELFEELRREMDRLFEETLAPTEAPMYDVGKKELRPLTHITEVEDEIVVEIDLPYVRKEDIELYATENELRVEAPIKEYVKLSPWGPIQREVEFKSFKKVVRLPCAVDPRRSRARFKDGILEVRFLKKITGMKIEVT